MSRDCIICGRDNAVGARVRFQPEAEGVTARVEAPPHFQGFGGVLHGGLVTALLDDAMWWAIFARHRLPTMTVELTVRYRRPVPVGEPLLVSGRITEARKNSRLFLAHGTIHDDAGTLLAEADAKFLPAPPDLAAVFTRQMV